MESALIQLFPALDNTAKRCRPGLQVGARIRAFIADNEALISFIATRNVIIGGNFGGETFPEVIYKFARCSLLHEGHLDARLKVGDFQEVSLGGQQWKLPKNYVFALTIVVMAAPVNGGEQLPADAEIQLLEQPVRLSEIWGAKAALEARLIALMPNLDLSRVSTIVDAEIAAEQRPKGRKPSK